jgi:hypothetical protein
MSAGTKEPERRRPTPFLPIIITGEAGVGAHVCENQVRTKELSEGGLTKRNV